MFQITSVMTTTFRFSWQTPVILNGVLTGYQLSCQPQLPGIPLPHTLTPGPTAVMAMLSSLYPGVMYNCRIVARNGVGPSDPVYISGTTLETGTYAHVNCFFFWCFKLHGFQLVNRVGVARGYVLFVAYFASLKHNVTKYFSTCKRIGLLPW